MTANPYESPQSVGDEQPPTPPTTPEKGLGSIVVLMFGTVCGGLAGNLLGNLVARALWPPPIHYQGLYNFISIQHPLSLVLLSLGCIVGGFLADRLTGKFRARRSNVISPEEATFRDARGD